jgi:hypothetical protein
MNLHRQPKASAEIDMDRRIIRVDLPPANAGVTAALRRAFAPVNGESSDREFADLLRKLS